MLVFQQKAVEGSFVDGFPHKAFKMVQRLVGIRRLGQSLEQMGFKAREKLSAKRIGFQLFQILFGLLRIFKRDFHRLALKFDRKNTGRI